jgi:hypothetical protein
LAYLHNLNLKIMTKYREILNEETGERDFLFNAKLLKISTNIFENSNSKEFKIVTLKFNLPSGEEVERTGMCYANNYEYGIEVGKDYVCNLRFDDEGIPQIQMSHLNNANRANEDDFAGLFQVQEQLIEDDLVM